MNNLSEKLLELPEPILVVGHRHPDCDAASATAAVLHFLRWHNKETYTHVTGDFRPETEWIYEAGDFAHDQLGERIDVRDQAQSAICLDHYPDPDRLGWDLDNYPNITDVVVVDHHQASIERHDPGKGVYALDVPSTGCVLIQGGVVHPILYVGLWADTVAFKFNGLRAMWYVGLLRGRCDQGPEVGGCDTKLTQDLIQQYHDKLYLKYNDEFLMGMKELEIIKTDIGGHSLIVALSGARAAGVDDDILGVLCDSGNTVVRVNKWSGRASFRTDGDYVNVRKIAELYDGGGHDSAAGAMIAEGYVKRDVWWNFQQTVADKVTEQLEADVNKQEMLL